ncbi:autotransporter outer membrane beta-barrel domain-containing protein [Citrobacter freundii]|nr:autotransporter outer membrane beta-barrel domain-containing protein [Citrobacter freundii]
MDGLVHVASADGGAATFTDSTIDFTANQIYDNANVPFYGTAALIFDGEQSSLSLDNTSVTSHTLAAMGTGDSDINDNFDGIDVNGDDNDVSVSNFSRIDAAGTGLNIAGNRTNVVLSNSFITAADDGILSAGDGNTVQVSDYARIDAQKTGISVTGSGNKVTVSTGAMVSGTTAIQLADTATDATLKVEGATLSGETALDIATADAANVTFTDAQVEGAIRSDSSVAQSVSLSDTNWTGDAVAASTGGLDVNLSDSLWKGSASSSGAGPVSISLANSAIWINNADSSVTDVTMNDGSTLLMNGGDITTQTLNGEGATMIYSTYNTTTQSASLLTADTASGVFGTGVVSGTSGSAGDMTGDSIVHVTDASNATFEASVSDVGVYRYATTAVVNSDGSTDVVLKDADDVTPIPPDPDDGGNTPDDGGNTPDDGGNTPDDGGNTPDDGGNTPDDGGNTPDDGGNTPSHHTLSTAAQSVVNTRAAAVNLWRDEEDALVLRMDGERRSGNDEGEGRHGVWGSYYGGYHRQQMNETSTSFDQTNNGFMLGADMRTDTTSGHWLTGFAVMRGYADINMHDAGSAGTKSDSYGAALYASWRADNGVFVDGMLKGEHLKNDMDVVSTDGGYSNGNYSTNGYGASLRAGYHWAITPAFWAEPYARVSYIRYDGVDYRLSNGLRAKDDDYTSLRAEGGANVGTALTVGRATVKPYLHLAVADETANDNNMDINGVNVDDNTDGTQGIAGLGADVAFTSNLSAQVGANYAKGEDTESPWQVGAGVTWTW